MAVESPQGPDAPVGVDYFLMVGRLVSYKKFDVAIRAFNELKLPLKIIGTGPEMKRLKKMAHPNIEFLGQVSDDELGRYYREARALIFPQEEDFGIVPLESMASGRPVIAYRAGGAMETVVEGKTGTFFPDQSWESLAHKIIRFNPEEYRPEEIRAHAVQFDTAAFKEKIKSYIEKSWQEFKSNG